MPKFNMTRQYPHSAANVFAVASDIASYKHFLPLVRGSKAWGERTQDDGTVALKSALTIVYKRLNMNETIRSDMVVDRKAMTIRATSSDGLLKQMVSVWKVSELPDGGSEVEMDVDYTMKSKMMQLLVSSVFDMALRRIANALGDRVEALYGKQAANA